MTLLQIRHSKFTGWNSVTLAKRGDRVIVCNFYIPKVDNSIKLWFRESGKVGCFSLVSFFVFLFVLYFCILISRGTQGRGWGGQVGDMMQYLVLAIPSIEDCWDGTKFKSPKNLENLPEMPNNNPVWSRAAKYLAFWSSLSLRQAGRVFGLVSGLRGYFGTKRTRTGVLCEVIIQP